MPFPIDVSRYDLYLRMDAPDGIVVAGVFRRAEEHLYFRVLYTDSPQTAPKLSVESASAHQLVGMVLRKWDGEIGVDLAKSAHWAFEGIDESEIGGGAKYLPPPDRFEKGARSE